jgi:uncharacterized protein (TIGR03435 family)
MRFSVLRSTCVLMAVPAIMLAQAGNPSPRFEVAVIKPSAPFTPADLAAGRVHIGMKTNPVRVEIGFTNLLGLIGIAYRVEKSQIKGPDWMKGSQAFDIAAKMPSGTSQNQVPAMLQALLVDRFKLSAHRNTVDQLVYALSTGPSGPRMELRPPEPLLNDISSPPQTKQSVDYEVGDTRVQTITTAGGRGTSISSKEYGEMSITVVNGATRLIATRMSMKTLAKALSPLFDRTVVDMTGLNGDFQFTVNLPLNSPLGQSAGPDPSFPPSLLKPSDIRSSLEKLGLKMEERKIPTELVIIDHLEKYPTEN